MGTRRDNKRGEKGEGLGGKMHDIKNKQWVTKDKKECNKSEWERESERDKGGKGKKIEGVTRYIKEAKKQITKR